MTVKILDILKGEISSYYTIEDLPKEWNESAYKVDLPRLAMESAGRLRRRAGANNITIPELINGLQILSQNPTEEFIQSITNFNTPNWATPDNQSVLKHIFGLIMAILAAS